MLLSHMALVVEAKAEWWIKGAVTSKLNSNYSILSIVSFDVSVCGFVAGSWTVNVQALEHYLFLLQVLAAVNMSLDNRGKRLALHTAQQAARQFPRNARTLGQLARVMSFFADGGPKVSCGGHRGKPPI